MAVPDLGDFFESFEIAGLRHLRRLSELRQYPSDRAFALKASKNLGLSVDHAESWTTRFRDFANSLIRFAKGSTRSSGVRTQGKVSASRPCALAIPALRGSHRSGGKDSAEFFGQFAQLVGFGQEMHSLVQPAIVGDGAFGIA